MKTAFVVFASFLLLCPLESAACNTCGCGVANYHYGILPQFRKNFIGLRYRYRSYISQLDDAHSVPYSYETFQSTELWGRFYPSKRIQAFIFVPYNFNRREEGDKISYLTGLGDIVVSANYNLINTYDSAAHGITHNLLIGAGLKLPTGQFRKIEDGLTVNQNFQLGTGSTDILLNLIHTMRYKKLGFNTEFTYNINTTNRDQYRFGNTSRTALTAFYILNSNAVTVMPNAGISAEFFQDNKQFGQPFPDTGGWAMLYNAGVEAYYKNIAAGVSYTHPGKQELFNSKVSSNDRISVHLTFMF
jgi:hypothetical protein